MLSIKEKKDFHEILKNNPKVIVDFYADWCGPCKMLEPIFEEVEKERQDYVFVRINTDLHPTLAREYKVMTIPSLKLFQEEELIKEKTGLLRKDELLEWIDE